MSEDRAGITNRLNTLAQQLRVQPNNKDRLLEIEQAVKGRSRFEQCYALDTLGRLGSLAQDATQTLAEGLQSGDPFVREAAAQALFRMGKYAITAKRGLIDVLHYHVNEGTVRYAVLALDEIGDESQEVLDALEYVAFAKDSYAASEAIGVYFKLTGVSLQQH